MKKLIIILGYVFFSVTCFSQETETRTIGSFDGIRVSTGIDVYLTKGEEESLRLETKGIDLEEVVTEVSGKTLKIYLEGNRYRSGGRSVEVFITYRQLEELSASSAANIYSREVIESPELDITASSAGNIEVKIKSESVEVSASSSGDIQLEGVTNRLKASASSAGDINAYDLESKIADVRASSAGSIRIFVIEELEARASSAGSIRYKGSPKRSNTDSSSGGSVKKIF